jgi:hypothetical protein
MKKILFSVMLFALATMLIRTGHKAFFSDVEMSRGNRFQVAIWEPSSTSTPESNDSTDGLSEEDSSPEMNSNIQCSLKGVPLSGEVPLEVQFTAAVTVTDNITEALTYTWQFADGHNDVDGLEQAHIYEQPGNYIVRFSAAPVSDPATSLCSPYVIVSVVAP